MIPDAAVEAAIAAFNDKLAWCDRNMIDTRLEDGYALRAALEAAAPHMLAEAWDEGMLRGSRTLGRLLDKWDENPYRSQTSE